MPASISLKSSVKQNLEDPTTIEKEKHDESEHIELGSDIHTKDFYFLPIPNRLQYRPGKIFPFGLLINVAFGLAGIFLTANMYYCQPLLIEMAKSFDVSYEGVSRIPTLIQAGYASSVLLISPLGDLVRRRQMFLGLVMITACLTIGLAITNNVHIFEVLTFFIGAASITPQILIPLAADLAPPERRGFAYSIVLTGLLVGLLIARVVAGTIGDFVTWRVVYYMAVGTTSLVVVCSYFIIPDYPPKNKGMTYWGILWTMAKYAVTEPQLIQIAFINVATSACFASYWVTLTFLLGGPPYNYSTLVIGLFGLLGIAGVATGPFGGRLMNHIHPWHGVVISTFLLMVFQAVQVAASGISIAAVVIACIGLDAFRQTQNIALATSMFNISMTAISRLNAIFVLSYYGGQILGTAVGTKVFIQFGWRACAGLNMAWYAFQLGVLALRGPHCKRYTWFGYEGGIDWRKETKIDE